MATARWVFNVVHSQRMLWCSSLLSCSHSHKVTHKILTNYSNTRQARCDLLSCHWSKWYSLPVGNEIGLNKPTSECGCYIVNMFSIFVFSSHFCPFLDLSHSSVAPISVLCALAYWRAMKTVLWCMAFFCRILYMYVLRTIAHTSAL